MKKGKNRRYREARELKRSEHGDTMERLVEAVLGEDQSPPETCPECSRTPHASWCRADEV
jgi:hypothetical protein